MSKRRPQTPLPPEPTTTTTTTPMTPTISRTPPQLRSKIPFRPRKTRKLSTPHNPKSQQPISQLPSTPHTIPKPLSSDSEIAAALHHLRHSDPLLSPLIDTHPPPTFDSSDPPFLALSKSIIYQQLAAKAANSIYTRFSSLCGGDSSVVPDAVLALSPQQLREVGVSARKASYLHDLASKYESGILSDGSIMSMDDKSLFAMLTMVKGIGPWSVHMFLIFSLRRPDVLPVGDLGVRKGVQMLYGLKELPKAAKMEELCEKWRPYRSVGAWYMWRLVEAKGAKNVAAVAVEAEKEILQPQPLQQLPPEERLQLLEPINGIADLG